MTRSRRSATGAWADAPVVRSDECKDDIVGVEHVKTSVSVVICAFTERRRNQTEAAVESVLRQLDGRHELILVIDHNPMLLEWARSRWPQLLVVPSAGEPGLSDARNTGLGVATSDVVAFLDDDAIATPQWLSTLVARYENDSNVVGVGGRVTPKWLSGRPRWFPAEFDWVVGCVHSGMPSVVSPVRNVVGANMSFRRSLLVEIGGFRRGLGRVGSSPMGCEETDACIRARSGRPASTILYDPGAEVHHSVPRSRASVRYFLSRCLAEGRSKAMLAGAVGSQAGLADERVYVRRTLPRGVVEGVGAAVRGDPAGLARAGAIVLGLSATTVGYASRRAVTTGLFRRSASFGLASPST